MEVHTHTHPSTNSGHRKKWTHYFWEFLMLFLAVFCGFLAENQREHMVEHHREKQFMESLINDLTLDTAYLNICIKSIDNRVVIIDSVLKFFLDNKNAAQIPIKIVRTMISGTTHRSYFEQRSTIDQLNNSGGMRLIRKRKVVDSIGTYYQQCYRFSTWRERFFNYQSIQEDFHKKIFNAYDMIKYTLVKGANDDAITKIDASYLNQYLNHLLLIRRYANNDKDMEYTLIGKAGRLISMIKNEYHLE